jgi:hypothetical protein
MYLSINSPEFDTFHGFSLQPSILSLSSYLLIMVRSLTEAEAQLWEQLSQLNKNAQFSKYQDKYPTYKLYKHLNDPFLCTINSLPERYDSALLDDWLADSVVYTQHQIDVIIIEKELDRLNVRVWIYSPVVHATLEGKLQLHKSVIAHRENCRNRLMK